MKSRETIWQRTKKVGRKAVKVGVPVALAITLTACGKPEFTEGQDCRTDGYAIRSKATVRISGPEGDRNMTCLSGTLTETSGNEPFDAAIIRSEDGTVEAGSVRFWQRPVWELDSGSDQ